jgi:hypothetical protein
MPRPLPQPRRAELAPEDVELFDYAVSRQYPDATPGDEPDLGLYHGTLLNSPAFARLFELGGETVRMRGEDPDSYSQRDRALVDHVLSAELETNAVLGHFITEGLSLGIDIPTQRAVREGRDEDLSADDRFLAEYARATVRGELSDEQWERMVGRIGPKGALEYTSFINYLLMTIRNIQATCGRAGEPSDEEIERLLSDYETGARAAPAPRPAGLTGHGNWS